MKKIILTIVACLAFTFAVSAQTTSQDSLDNDKLPAKDAKPKRVIFRATSEQIIQIQDMLKKKGTFKGESDGRFTKDFRDAVKIYQGENDLTKTGTLNRATLEKMGVELTDKQKAYPVNPNSFAGAGDDDEDDAKTDEPKTSKKAFRPTKAQIAEAQTMLKADKKYTGDTDGRYNDDFRDAVKTYQEANGLDKNGKLDEATLGKMGIALTDSQKGIETASATMKSDKPRRVSFRVNKEQISEAQTKLKSAKLFSSEVDGKYSKDLRDAIKEFQSANGLSRTGSLNRVTLEKMSIVLTESQMEIPVNSNDIATEKSEKAKTSDNSDKPKRRIFRASADQIMQVQAKLKELGMYAGEETGKLNPATRTAIREWQSKNNINKTGTLNKETLEAMKVELTDTQKEF